MQSVTYFKIKTYFVINKFMKHCVKKMSLKLMQMNTKFKMLNNKNVCKMCLN